MGRHRRLGTGEGVEQRRLAGVGQTDETQSFHWSRRYRLAPGRSPAHARPQAAAGLRGPVIGPIAWKAMSKRTVKRKIRSKKKANHGKRPNAGRG
jgi:hypothetical protein